MPKEWIAVAIGGMLGAVARHALSSLFSLIGPSWLPMAALTANALGCFAMGALAQWSFQQDYSGQWWVIGARVGLLGGLTTFSSFALDIVRLWNSGRAAESALLASTHLALGITALVVGMTCMRAIPQE